MLSLDSKFSIQIFCNKLTTGRKLLLKLSQHSCPCKEFKNSKMVFFILQRSLIIFVHSWVLKKETLLIGLVGDLIILCKRQGGWWKEINTHVVPGGWLMRLLPYEVAALKMLILILIKQSKIETHALFCPKIFGNSFYWNLKLYSSNEESFSYAELFYLWTNWF